MVSAILFHKRNETETKAKKPRGLCDSVTPFTGGFSQVSKEHGEVFRVEVILFSSCYQVSESLHHSSGKQKFSFD